MARRAEANIKAVIFDMGGVLVELGPLTEILGDDEISPEQFWTDWLSSPTVRAFETGDCTTAEFGLELCSEMDLPFSPDELINRFLNWPKGLYPQAAELVNSLNERNICTGLLSNTNPLHWEHQVDKEEIRSLFTHNFLSFEIGIVKPDLAIFEHVIDQLALPADSIFFLDDNQMNVAGAAAAGINGYVTKGPSEAKQILDNLKLR